MGDQSDHTPPKTRELRELMAEVDRLQGELGVDREALATRLWRALTDRPEEEWPDLVDEARQKWRRVADEAIKWAMERAEQQ